MVALKETSKVKEEGSISPKDRKILVNWGIDNIKLIPKEARNREWSIVVSTQS